MTELERKLWQKSIKYVGRLRIVPFVRMIAVCNNLAIGNVDQDSDIDLFIIAKKGRLFLVRLMVTVLLHVFGVRRTSKKVSGRFCLSFFIDDSDLNLNKISIPNDLYLSLWIKTLVPIVDNSIYKDFLKANDWVENYFKFDDLIFRKPEYLLNDTFLTFKTRSFLRSLLKGNFGDNVEKKLMKWQLKRASKKLLQLHKKDGIVLSKNMLKFHNLDRRKLFRDQYFEKYNFQSIDENLFRNILN